MSTSLFNNNIPVTISDPNYFDWGLPGNEPEIVKGNDISFQFDLPTGVDWVTNKYNITIYDSTRATLASIPLVSGTNIIPVSNFSTSGDIYFVVEDRSDINNINEIKTIGKMTVTLLDYGATDASPIGFITVDNPDGTTTNLQVYQTGIKAV